MRKLITLLYILFISVFSNGQEKIDGSDVKPCDCNKEIYKCEKKNLCKKDTIYKEVMAFSSPQDLKKGAVSNYLFDIQEAKLNYNNKMLNVLFASEVSTYLNDSEDLTLQQAYAVLSTDDNTLFLGGSFDFRGGNKLTKLTHLATIGIKTKVSDDFSTLFENSEIQNEIGFNLKYTSIGRGIIRFNKDQACISDKYREGILAEKYQKEVNKYIDETLSEEIKKGALSDPNTDKLQKKLLKKKANEIYEKMAEEEISFLKEEQLYSSLLNHWVTFELFLPVSEVSYNIIEDINNSEVAEEEYLPWKMSGGWTGFYKSSRGSSFYLSSFASVFNNNSVVVEDLTKLTQPILDNNNDNFQTSTRTVYSGDFKVFSTFNIKGEAIYFFNKNIGLSAAIEQNFGDEYDALNWKLGIPISLKDKEGKPTINFELLWKEINTNTNANHFVGVSVGYSFGKFIQ